VNGRRETILYVALICFALGLAWLGSNRWSGASDGTLDEDRLARLIGEIALPPIDLTELPFGFLRPSPRHRPRAAQPRTIDEVELALVHNRNQLLFTSAPTAQPRRID